MSEVVAFELSGAVARVTLERPEKLNAINDDMLHGLADALGRAAADPGVRALIVTGRGRAFSAGGDIAEMEGMAGSVRSQISSPVSTSLTTVPHGIMTSKSSPERPVLLRPEPPCPPCALNLLATRKSANVFNDLSATR